MVSTSWDLVGDLRSWNAWRVVEVIDWGLLDWTRAFREGRNLPWDLWVVRGLVEMVGVVE